MGVVLTAYWSAGLAEAGEVAEVCSGAVTGVEVPLDVQLVEEAEQEEGCFWPTHSSSQTSRIA